MADGRPNLISAVCYRDPRAALAWLEKAFGFELVFLVEDAEGNLGHSEMRFGNAAVMIGNEWSDDHKSPASVSGKNTQTVHIQLSEGDLDAHCARARAAGADIIVEPETQFYGDRTYRCKDPEGHIWTVARTVETVSVEEMERRTGLKITGQG
ncbi:VOC family protein [Caulobacter henricii]|uniref:Glyoxalase n=1 Tax=Caulobacter henricii TaxID=69395 RepID=A0A0P0NYE5_9CAUL|nr:VOC family protein [Caulobacter henricii]ALL13007.1 glyoxalase [Caulobacter henricii]